MLMYMVAGRMWEEGTAEDAVGMAHTATAHTSRAA